MKAEENYRLLSAALSARDDLRSVVMPACEQLTRLAGANPEIEALIRKIHATAWRNADQLRFAMKDRAPVFRRCASA